MKLSIERVVVPRGRRPIDEAKVTLIKGSMKEIGLRTPITVRKVRGNGCFEWRLITGRHRLAAAKALEWAQIDCVEEAGTDSDAKLWEIAENLHRAELTTQQRADQTE